MAGYTRDDVTNQIADTNVINAAPLNGEFNAIEAAFQEVSGHKHDGSFAEGAPITVVGPTQDVVVTATTLRPKTDNIVDLGTPTLEFKDLWIDGTANIDNLAADAATVAGSAVTTAANTQTLTNKTLTAPVINGTVNNTGTDIRFSLGGSLRLLIDADDVQQRGLTTETQRMFVGSGRAGDGTSSLNLVTEASGASNLSLTAYAGAGGVKEIRTVGSGAFQIVNTEAAPILFTTDLVERLRIGADGRISVGVTAPATGAFADFTSVTGGLAIPRMTTVQRDAIATPVNGIIIYNTTDNELQIRANSAWQPVVSETNTQTLANKTINLANNTLITTSAQLAAAVTDETGSGALVFSTSPVLAGTPTAPTATVGTNSTQVATTAYVVAERGATATLTGKTITSPVISSPDIDGGAADNLVIGATTPAAGTFTNLAATTATVAGASVTTSSNTQTLTNKTISLANNTFVATSAQLASSITDETGTGVVVFNNGPTLTSPTINGSVTFSDAAQARSALSTPATPTGSGVGQWATLAGAVGGAFSVPAGGTWAIGLSVVDTTGVLAGVQYFTGVVAGGTSVWPGVAGQRVIGFGWRVS